MYQKLQQDQCRWSNYREGVHSQDLRIRELQNLSQVVRTCIALRFGTRGFTLAQEIQEGGIHCRYLATVDNNALCLTLEEVAAVLAHTGTLLASVLH